MRAAHHDALVEFALFVDVDEVAQHGTPHAATADDDARAKQRVVHLGLVATAFAAEHGLCRRVVVPQRVGRPVAAIQVEARGDTAQIHVRVEVGFDRADVAPVRARIVADAAEVARVDLALRNHARDHVHAEVAALVLGHRGVFVQALHEFLGLEHVDAHRREAVAGVAGDLGWIALGLLLEARDAPFRVHLEDAELVRLALRDADGADREGGLVLDVLAQHRAVVHVVDVVAGEHEHVRRLPVLDRVEVVVDRVRGAAIPTAFVAVVRWPAGDELLEPARQEVPAEADVLLERARLVLRQDVDATQARMDAVAEREVDDAIGATERHGGLRAVHGQRLEAIASATGQQEHEGVASVEVRHGERQRNGCRARAMRPPENVTACAPCPEDARRK